jgi:hypothetical protein
VAAEVGYNVIDESSQLLRVASEGFNRWTGRSGRVLGLCRRECGTFLVGRTNMVKAAATWALPEIFVLLAIFLVVLPSLSTNGTFVLWTIPVPVSLLTTEDTCHLFWTDSSFVRYLLLTDCTTCEFLDYCLACSFFGCKENNISRDVRLASSLNRSVLLMDCLLDYFLDL